MALSNISVVLVGTQGSLNIGMVARAMKNCGLERLKLVSPVKYNITEAYRMACFAKDIIDKAQHFNSLKEALADSACSAAFARRISKDRSPYFYLENISTELVKRSKKGGLALVFGRETDGLTNEEIYQCSFRISIPANEPDGSFNLAQAVLLACYELYKKSGATARAVKWSFAEQKEVDVMIKSFDKAMFGIGYNNMDKGKLRKKIVKAFRDICGRAGLREKDVNMFLGICSQIQKNGSAKED